MVYIVIISVVVYVIAVISIYYNTYGFTNDQKVQFIFTGIIAVLIITTIIVFLSASNIQIEKKYLNITKVTAILIFAPINSIIALPYLANLINRYITRSIETSKLKRSIEIILVIYAIIAIVEISYIKNFQIGLLNSL